MAEPNEEQNNNTTATATATEETNDTQDNGQDQKRPEQTVTIEDIAVGEKKLTIEIPEQRIKDTIEQAYVGLENDAQLPGFRKGKAPRKLLQKRFAGTLKKETTGQIISESTAQAIEDESLNILGEPSIKDIADIELPDSGPLTFEVNVEVAPDITLPDLSTLKIEKPSAEVTDEQVDQDIQRYCEQFGNLEQVEDEPTKQDDYITADVAIYAGQSVDEKSEPITTYPNSNIIIHGEDYDHRGHVANIHVDDLGKQLDGKKIGDSIDVSLTGPESHNNENIKGKPITIRIKIDAIQRVKPLTIEQLVERLGVEDEQKLKERVREMLEGQAYRQQQQNMQSQAMEQLLEAIEVEIPEALANRQIEQTIAQRKMYRDFRAAQGHTDDSEQQSEEQEKEQVTKQVHDELKRFFIISQAAKDFEINIDDDEINYEIVSRAIQNNQRPNKLRKQMRENGELQQLAMQLREQKTLTEIVGKADVTDKEGNKDEKKD